MADRQDEVQRLMGQSAQLMQGIANFLDPSGGGSRYGSGSGGGSGEYNQYRPLIQRFIDDDNFRAGLKEAVTRIKRSVANDAGNVTNLPSLLRGATRLEDLLRNDSEDLNVLGVLFNRIPWEKSDEDLKSGTDYKLRNGPDWFY